MLFLRIVFLCIGVGGVIISPLGSYATQSINTWQTGYRFALNQTADITLADGSCKRVTNDGTNRFIPTKTMAEWLSFSSVASFLGINIGGCAVNGGWSAWSACACSGTQVRTCTNPSPANGGATCVGSPSRGCTPPGGCPINGLCIEEHLGEPFQCWEGAVTNQSWGIAHSVNLIEVYWDYAGSNGGTTDHCHITTRF